MTNRINFFFAYFIILAVLFWYSSCAETQPPEAEKAPLHPRGSDHAVPNSMETGAAKPGLGTLVASISEKLHEQKLIYSSKPADFRDCSGMLLRVLNAVQDQCPGVEIPDKNRTRSSRNIAGWYAEHGALTLIHDVFKQEALLEPGVILFYGRRNRHYQNITLRQALREIKHTGVAVAVERDKTAKLISYRLFHGRSGRKPASITNYHFRKPSRKRYPPFGNGTQQWVAAATLCPEPPCSCVDMPALEETPPEITPESVFSAHHEEELKTLTDQDKKIQQGMASWYGPGFEGKKTANGEIFSARRLTAAHHFLAFGAKIKVTNLENGLSVIVRINDRIPKTNKTVIIDLSKAAAKKIDMLAHGKVPVKLEYE